MRTTLIAIMGAALSLAACSPSDQTEVKEGVDSAVADIKETGTNIKNDPDVQEARDAIKGAVGDGGAALKSVAGEAADAMRDAAAETKAAASDAADRTKAASDAAKADLAK